MEIAIALVALTVGVCVVSALCDRLRWPTPLVLVVVGAAVSLVPVVPEFSLGPELVLNGLLPPLLYATTARASLVDFNRNKTATLLLSVVLVVFTTLVVGWTTSWLLPGVALAACMALGAVVAPPDAVAASAIGQRLGLPRRVATLLEEESLLNDATALIALAAATSALTSELSPLHIGGEFVLAVVGAVLIGGVVAAVLALVRTRIRNPVLDTAVSFVAPYLAFLPAEALHVSGVLSVVVAGLALAHVSPKVQTAASRVAEALNWRTVAFLLENAVFLLIGLQFPLLVRGAADSGFGGGRILLVCAGVLVATVAARFAFVFAVAGILTAVPPWRRKAWPGAVSVLVSWAGMRGVVTLAAAQLIPEDVPGRDVLLLAAFAVVVGTLLVQGLSLPWVVRRVGLPAPDPAQDALQAAALGDAASAAGLRRLDELLTGDEPRHVVGQLRKRSKSRSHAAWERLGRPEADVSTPSAVYTRLRLEMLAAERAVVVEARDRGTAEPEVLQRALADVDFEEALLDRLDDLEPLAADRRLGGASDGGCAHLRTAGTRDDATARWGGPPTECAECVAVGATWVHLRTCLACGHTGCCDSSELRHSRAHFAGTAHPAIVSAEPGEAWRWCWVDEELG
ncbi:cation:proton antiporter [Kineococcus radiotolerans]|uniref:Sodium/hydrogen exchanger n=1 Tax=Kineococcus radiotolerans (strain ATCC BAA-149 / DSM 14245 / SRS30216) TaxID=266940 RepID=A6WG22_KINRD|nr:cation:proton antiporter [Kineococcus radiotolerans]ABS05761.1 sodium/hydrogen exchanger [Kineococcus radiotolerans SRS30216 = ATCC BAA-149]